MLLPDETIFWSREIGQKRRGPSVDAGLLMKDAIRSSREVENE
jgi:hypothetical protein